MTRVCRLLAAYAVASLAIGLPWPLLLVLMWNQYGEGPHGVWAVGLAGAARMAPYVLLSWAVGSLGDHVARDRLVRVTLLLRLVFLAGAALALLGDHVGLAVVATALAVTSGTPTYPAIAAALPRLAGVHRARATQVLVTIEVSAWVVGPALGGLLLVEPLRPWTLVVAVGLAALALVLSSGIRIPGPAERAPDALAGMLRAVRHCRPALAALGMAGLLNVVVTTTGVVLLPLSHESWHAGEAGFGTATACLGFGALGAPVLARLAAPTRIRSIVILGVALLVVAVSPVQWPALPMLVLAGAAGVVVESLVTGTLQDVVPDRHRAGALGLADTVMVGGCLVGSLVAPALARSAGARPAMVLVALAVALPVLATRLVPARRRATPYDAAGERARPESQPGPDPRSARAAASAPGPDPRSASPVGPARVG